MKQARYTDIQIGHDVNCSSSQNYSVPVSLKERGERKRYWYDPALVYPLEPRDSHHHSKDVPRYVIIRIEALIREALAADKLTFYEYNQDSEKRYTDLRYHDLEYFKRLIGVAS